MPSSDRLLTDRVQRKWLRYLKEYADCFEGDRTVFVHGRYRFRFGFKQKLLAAGLQDCSTERTRDRRSFERTILPPRQSSSSRDRNEFHVVTKRDSFRKSDDGFRLRSNPPD